MIREHLNYRLVKWLLAVGLLAVVLIVTACGSPPTDTTPVTFPDANLETAIREAIKKPQGSIYASDLEALTSLEVWRKGISDLTGLEYCVNLRWLALVENNIRDLSPLARLTKLETLALVENNISDLSALAGLTNLGQLYLTLNYISDISPLVENSGLSDGDIVQLYSNGLSNESRQDYVPQLEARGVIVEY